MLSIVWPSNFADTQSYGETDLALEPWWPAANCHWHCGIDIGMPIGTPLYAPRAGTAIYSSWGLLAIQAADDARIDWFVHIDSSLVGRGARVAKGDLVAYSGAKVPTGGSLTGPHLHFEVQAGSLNHPATSINPLPVLTAGTPGGKTAMATIDDIYQLLGDVNAITLGRLETKLDAMNATTLGRLETEILALKVQITALPAGSGPAISVQPVLDAITALKVELDAVGGDVAAVKRRIEKDLAP